MLLIELLTVAHVVIHIGKKDYIHGNLKKSMKNLKIWNQHLEKKAHGTTKSPFTPKIYIRSMN